MSRTVLIPTQITRLLSTAVVLTFLAATGHAQFTVVVAEDDFDSYTDTSFVVFTDGTSLSLVPDGSGGNAVQFSFTTAGGFLARGFDFQPFVQPGDTGTNLSANRADYQVTFDLIIDSTYIPANGFEIWLKDEAGQGDPENDPSASLYSVGLGGFTTGVPQTVTFTLDTSINDAPFAHENGSGYNPDLVDMLQVRFNGLDFNSPADMTFTFTVDNFSLRTIPEPSSLLLGVVSAGGLCFVGWRRHRV